MSISPAPRRAAEFDSRATEPVSLAPELAQTVFDLTTAAVLLAGRTCGVFLDSEQIFRRGLEGVRAVDLAFAASRGRQLGLVARVQRLADGRVTSLVMPQLLPAAAAAPAVALEADFSQLPTEALADIEVEIYLRTDEDRLIDLLDFSEISEEADEDEYVVGYVALAHLLRHQSTLHRYGAFLARTGRLRPVHAGEDFPEEAA